MKRTGKFGSVNLLAETMRSYGFVVIHGSSNSKSHEEKCYHGNGLALEDCAQKHCQVFSLLLSSKDGGSSSHF